LGGERNCAGGQLKIGEHSATKRTKPTRTPIGARRTARRRAPIGEFLPCSRCHHFLCFGHRSALSNADAPQPDPCDPQALAKLPGFCLILFPSLRCKNGLGCDEAHIKQASETARTKPAQAVTGR
jgi:hypothetical protein